MWLQCLPTNQACYKLSKMVQYVEIGLVFPEIFDILFKRVAFSRTLPLGPENRYTANGRFAARNTVRRYFENSSSKNFVFCKIYLDLG